MILSVVAILFTSQALASDPQILTNTQVNQAWQQINDGSALDVRGSITPEFYSNHVSSANGSTNTALKEGVFHKEVLQSSVRHSNNEGTSQSFQLNVTETDDPAVLSKANYQINNLQFSQTGQTYSIAAGDVAPNFSTLSSALATRGLLGRKQFSDTNLNAYGGIASESWEALDGRTDRSQFLRDTYGVKIEQTLIPEIKVYGTAQQGADRSGTLTNPQFAPYGIATKIRAATVGASYDPGPFHVASEFATSDHSLDQHGDFSGQALIADASYKLQSLTLRGGFHHVDPGFVSLSSMAMPGIKETYTGADWTTTSWLNLGADLRNSKTLSMASTNPTSDTNSSSIRAGINFEAKVTGRDALVSCTDECARKTGSIRPRDKN